MKIEEYLADPCGASALPYWKTETVSVPKNVTVMRDDVFDDSVYNGKDEPFFKLIHDLQAIREPILPKGFALVPCSIEDYVKQINACYTQEHLSAEALLSYRSHPVYRPNLWLAVADTESGALAATGIAELDARIGEGILEWIQVLPVYRRKGLGAFVVCELLRRMRSQAVFATVSGRVRNETAPFALYEACGFTNPVIWHVVTDLS